MKTLCALLLILLTCNQLCCLAQPSEKLFAGKARLVLERGAGEGPAWHPKLGLLFSGDGGINRLGPDGKLSVYRPKAGTNGLLLDSQGRLLTCESRRRRITRTEADGTIKVLAQSYGGKRFNQPNDITVDSRGRIFFSDPQYGDRSGMEMIDSQGKEVEGVYRIDPDGKVTRIITHEVDRPNGLLVTPDDRTLYVADNNNNERGGARKLWRFDLQSDGNIDPKSQRLVFDWGNSRGPDGMVLDRAGRLYVAGGLNKPNPPAETTDHLGGVYVFSPTGKLLEFVPIPRDEVTNCTFGGKDLKTLYVTAGGTLWSIRTTTAGTLAWAKPAAKNAQTGKPKKRSKFRWVNPLPKGKYEGVTHGVFRSPSMKRDVGYCIYLPPEYGNGANAKKRYPVVYYLHGGRPGNETKSVGLSVFVDAAIKAKKIPPVIYVFVNGGEVSHYNYPEKQSMGEDVFIKELIPHVDHTYRTIAKRAGRGLEGFSQGGRGTTRIMFKHPNVFCSAAPGGAGHGHEKRISESDGRESEFLKFAPGYNTYDLARQYAKNPQPPLPILIYVGDKGFNYENNLAYMEFLTSLKIPFRKLIVPSAPHSGKIIYQKSGLEIMRFHADNFRKAGD